MAHPLIRVGHFCFAGEKKMALKSVKTAETNEPKHDTIPSRGIRSGVMGRLLSKGGKSRKRKMR